LATKTIYNKKPFTFGSAKRNGLLLLTLNRTQSVAKKTALAWFFLPILKQKTMENHKRVEMTSMTGCISTLEKEGYSENFVMKDVGMQAPTSQKLYNPEEITVDSFYRFEGDSDPADNAIIYAITSNDGLKGLLVDAYGGPYVNQKIASFISEVEKISKRHTDKN
jgi:hypothetical protein